MHAQSPPSQAAATAAVAVALLIALGAVLATAFPILLFSNVQPLSESRIHGCCNSSLAMGRSVGSFARHRSFIKSSAFAESLTSGGNGGRARLLNSYSQHSPPPQTGTTHLEHRRDLLHVAPRPLSRPHFQDHTPQTPDINLARVGTLVRRVNHLGRHPKHRAFHRRRLAKRVVRVVCCQLCPLF